MLLKFYHFLRVDEIAYYKNMKIRNKLNKSTSQIPKKKKNKAGRTNAAVVLVFFLDIKQLLLVPSTNLEGFATLEGIHNSEPWERKSVR